MLEECRSVDRYEKLNRISEGTYGVVYRWVVRNARHWAVQHQLASLAPLPCCRLHSSRPAVLSQSWRPVRFTAVRSFVCRARDRDTGEICALKKVRGWVLARLDEWSCKPFAGHYCWAKLGAAAAPQC